MTVTVTPTVEPGNTPPRVRLNVVDSTGANQAVTVVRQHPDGSVLPVRTSDGGALPLGSAGSTRIGLLYDYEPPYGQGVRYWTLQDTATVSAYVSLTAPKAWLIHPGVPALSQPITIAGVGDRTRKVQRGVFQPMGRARPVVQTDGARKSAEYSLRIVTGSLAELASIDALISDASVLLLNVDPGKGWAISYEYVSIGDVTEARPTTYLGYSDRTWELPCTVVDQPLGGSMPQWTWASVKAQNASWAALKTRYATWFDVKAGS